MQGPGTRAGSGEGLPLGDTTLAQVTGPLWLLISDTGLRQKLPHKVTGKMTCASTCKRLRRVPGSGCIQEIWDFVTITNNVMVPIGTFQVSV